MDTRYIIWVATLLVISVVGADAHVPFTATDNHQLNKLGDFAVGPGSNPQVVYAVSQWSASNPEVSTTRLYSAGSTFTSPPIGTKDYNPVFTPDGKYLFYLSNQNSGSNVFYKSTTLGLTTQLSDYAIPISNLIVATNYIVFTAEIYTDCGTNFDCTAQRDADRAAHPNFGVVYDKMFVRHWDVYETPGKNSQLFSQAIRPTSTGYDLVGDVVWLTQHSPSGDIPVPPDGGLEQLSLSPKEDRLAYTIHVNGHDQAWTTGWVIYEILLNPQNGANRQSPVCLTCSGNGARTTNPQYDPTGKFMAYLAMDRPGFEADRLHLVLYDIATAKTTSLTGTWDRSVSEFSWSADGSTIFAGVDDYGSHKIFSVAVGTGKYSQITGNGTAGHIVVTSSNTVFYTFSSWSTASDIWSFKWTNNGPTNLAPVTNLNPSLQSFGLDSGSYFTFSSDNSSTVQGWFFKPAGWVPGQSYPFVLLIHGGPQGAWNSGWSYRWNPQLWAQQGYAVAMINPHGSSGFGQAFCDAVSGHWGGIPYRDLMNGMDYVLASYPWIDSTRTAACGASYGGYMINWINANTKRFSALVVHDGIYDVEASYGSTDELWFPEWEFKGTPWSNPAGYQRWNPANKAAQMVTPTLVVHGGKDFRLPISQGLMAFSSLQRRGIPSKLLFFPLENHWVSKPTNSVQWYSEVLKWLKDWTSTQK